MGVLDTGDRDKDNAIGLQEGRVKQISIIVLHSRAAPSLDLLTLDYRLFVGTNNNERHGYFIRIGIFNHCFVRCGAVAHD